MMARMNPLEMALVWSLRLCLGMSALLWASPVAAANATPTTKPHDACFVRRDINGFSAPNDRTVYIRVGVKDVYRLDLMNACVGLTFRQSFGLEDQPATPWICSPLDATVVYRETGIPQRCPVTAIHRLTPEEVAALPKRDKP